MCYHCKQKIAGPGVSIELESGPRQYHRKCVFCSDCNAQVHTFQLKIFKDKQLCPKSQLYFLQFLFPSKLAFDRDLILRQCMSSEQFYWHSKDNITYSNHAQSHTQVLPTFRKRNLECPARLYVHTHLQERFYIRIQSLLTFTYFTTNQGPDNNMRRNH